MSTEQSTHGAGLAGGRDETSHRDTCRSSAAQLRALLAGLFPDDPSPDLITLENVLDRYPLTGLGAPATAAIEQAQRIARARGDTNQAGLCEFHIGLIFLHFGDSRAAVGQFMAARNQWTLAGDAAATCLAHYAQGVGLARSFRYEPAMAQFGRAERRLNRAAHGLQSLRLGELGEALRPALEKAMLDVRRQLWSGELAGDSSDGGALGGTGQPANGPSGTVGGEPEQSEASRPDESAAPAGAPQWAGRRTGTASTGDGVAEAPVAAPISRLAQPRPPAAESWSVARPLAAVPAPAAEVGPVPGHQLQDDRYAWYVVHQRRDSWLPDLTEGTLLLVDTDPDQQILGGGDLVILGGRQVQNSSVIVRPQTTPAPELYCFVVQPEADGVPLSTSSDSRFMSTENGRSDSFDNSLVLGVVVGSWHRMLG